MNEVQITVEQLKEKIDKGETLFLLDVREPFEHKIANIGGTLIPLKEIPKRMNELEKHAEIVVFCHHGGRSQRAAEYLRGNGFEHVKNLTGGIDAWSLKIDPNVPRY